MIFCERNNKIQRNMSQTVYFFVKKNNNISLKEYCENDVLLMNY